MSRRPCHWKVLLAVLSNSLAVSCGGSKPAATAPEPTAATRSDMPAPALTGGAATTAAPVGAEPQTAEIAWKDMTAEQRKLYMKSVVLPRMKAEFSSFDEKAFGNMNCATCHGAGTKDGSFKMPNPQLPKLPSDEAGFKALMEKKPDVTKFMGSRVLPEMAHLVGEAPFDTQTKRGFGCFECHTQR